MNKSERLLSIIKEIFKKSKVCVGSLALLYGTDKRTIQKDFELLKKYFDNPFNKVDDCYFLIKQEQCYDLFKENHKTSKQFF